jgi:tetraacyldisaccharide 4'-kinase
MAGALAERALGATVHILDDGFQHASLARDIDIVLVTPDDLQGRRMPFGRLRSPVSALARADAVVTDNLGVAFDGHPQPPRRFRLDRMLGAPVAVERDGRLPSARTSVVAVAGIAQPERFETSLVRAGWQIARFMTFPDHHVVTKADVERIAAAAREVGAEVVLTTDKDAMRLRALAPLPVTFAAVPLAVTIQPLATDEGSFEGWLLERLRCVRRARA